MSSRDIQLSPVEDDSSETNKRNKKKFAKKRRATRAEIQTKQSEQRSQMREDWERKKRLIPIMCRWNNLAFFTSMLGLLLMVAEMEISRHVYNNNANWANIVIKSIQSVSTCLLYFLKKYWDAKLEVYKLKEIVHKSASVWSVKKFRRVFIFEIIVSVIHVPPYCDTLVGYIYGDLHSNALGCLMFLRLYMVPRMAKQIFKKEFVNHKVRLIGAINQVPFNNFFTLKALLNLQPYRLLLLTLTVYVIVSAYCYNVFEINIDECGAPGADEDECHPRDIYYWRWVVFTFALILGIEPATVPKSIIGQILTIVGAMVGTCLVAILIAVIAQSLTLSTTEARVVSQIRATSLTQKTKKMAILFIQSYWRWLVRISKRLPDGMTAREAGVLHGDKSSLVKMTASDHKVRERLITSLHDWRVAKRRSQMTSQLSSISQDVSVVMDKVMHIIQAAEDAKTNVQKLKSDVVDQLAKMNANLDRLGARKVGGKRRKAAGNDEVDALLRDTKM